MKSDALREYTRLRQHLLKEKAQLEIRLREINQALGSETPSGQTSPPSVRSEPLPQPLSSRGKKAGRGNKMSLREAVIEALSSRPLARNELVDAVKQAGFKFTTKDPLNSIGSVLYAKNSPIKKTSEGKFFVEAGAQT